MISIHIPMWGATGVGLEVVVVGIISIHIPVWGATPRIPSRIALLSRFQSTSPCGEQQGRCLVHHRPGRISIHIPVWEATSPSFKEGGEDMHISIHIPVWGATRWLRQAIRRPYFNPHPRVGSNPLATPGHTASIFQSTSPCGEQRRCPGCYENKYQTISIHIPVWGATRVRNISIHIPVWGATGVRGPRGPPMAHYFNPHPRVGSNHKHISIHIPVWGATTVGIMA